MTSFLSQYWIVVFGSLWLCAIVLGILWFNTHNKVNTAQYKYSAKPSVMTKREETVYRKLVEVFDAKFYIIPQVHLSALLEHKIKGQNWQRAFQHINGKSVDYILLNKSTLKPVCTVELDDCTHNCDARKRRDAKIERIFKDAQIPLVRFKNIDNLSNQEVVALFARVINT